MHYFYQTLTQVQIGALSDNQDGRHLSVCTCGHSNLIIYHPISSKFYMLVTLIKLFRSSSIMGFVQDDRQNGRRLSVCICGHSTFVIYYSTASKFRIWITLVKLSPKYGFCPITKMAAKMAPSVELGHLSPNFFKITYMDNFHQTIVYV